MAFPFIFGPALHLLQINRPLYRYLKIMHTKRDSLVYFLQAFFDPQAYMPASLHFCLSQIQNVRDVGAFS